MTDVPLFVAISALFAGLFRRGGDGWPLALGKGALAGFALVTLLGSILAVTVSSGPRRKRDADRA